MIKYIGMLLAALLLASCSTNTAPSSAQVIVTGTAAVDQAAVGTAEASQADWKTLPLVNARTGESFTLADFAGKTVYVEPMATWCTNCRQQLGNVKLIKDQSAAKDVVFIGLSVETNIAAADLATYAQEQGFDWTFAVMTPDMLAALVNTFGRSISSPPATPHFIIRADGSTTDLKTGIMSTDDLVSFIQSES